MRILVVDDSRSVRTGLRRKLEEAGYEIIEAINGKEAVRKTEEHRPHLVTMDIDMPEMDGFGATAAIRATPAGKNLPIIFVTSKDSLKVREQGFYLGATEFISKNSPSPWQDVLAAANRLLRCSPVAQDFTALVVEDNEVTLMLLGNILQGQGINVLKAKNGQEALEMAAQHRAEIDMVITDYMMPEMDGGELCLQLRSRLGFQHTPIIFLSGATERGLILNMFRAGATDYLMKPFAKEELLARLTVHLERWQLIKELNRSVTELEKLNKLRDEFVAMATHDLKNPLNGIMGFTSLLLGDNNLADKQRQMVNMVRNSSELMLEIVNDILVLSRLESGNNDTDAAPIPLAPVINLATASLQQSAFKKGVLLKMVNNCTCEAIIDGNRHSLLRIINNLLSNAIKFTQADGTVTVSLGMEEDHMLHLRVTDTGIGIPKELLPRLFEKFTKASRPGTNGEPGTGLGLAITKRLVEQQGGTIEVSSSEGIGSCFCLAFPISSMSR